MEKKKIFIFFTYQIIRVGGTQAYTAGRASYLKERGWEVYVFFDGPTKAKSAIPSLTEYIPVGGGCSFLRTPPYKYDSQKQEQFLNFMLKKLKTTNFKDCEIIVESHYDVAAYWAELFAAKIGARHFFAACNEAYRNFPGRYYADNLDFFYFKWKRNEIFGRVENLRKLFDGYKDVTDFLVEMPKVIRSQDAVQDVEYKKIDEIKKLDWNICHIGRIEKDFVPYAITGVSELARRYPDKKINFIFVGNEEKRLPFIKKTFKDIPNVELTFLGDLVPIPRVLFSKVDVILAMAGCANQASRENVITIVGNADVPAKTSGVLWCDTEEVQHAYGKLFSYVEVLENVLAKKTYDEKKIEPPPLPSAESFYDNFWTVLKNAEPTKEYFTERLLKRGVTKTNNWTAIFPFGSIARGARIILFGATKITNDYLKQIESQKNCKVEIGRDEIKKLEDQPYCQVVAIVDEHPEKFQGKVVSVDRLKITDYDAIVISALPQNAQEAYNKIVKTVPEMADRIIYHFKNIAP